MTKFTRINVVFVLYSTYVVWLLPSVRLVLRVWPLSFDTVLSSVAVQVQVEAHLINSFTLFSVGQLL